MLYLQAGRGGENHQGDIDGVFVHGTHSSLYKETSVAYDFLICSTSYARTAKPFPSLPRRKEEEKIGTFLLPSFFSSSASGKISFSESNDGGREPQKPFPIWEGKGIFIKKSCCGRHKTFFSSIHPLCVCNLCADRLLSPILHVSRYYVGGREQQGKKR